MNDLDESVLTVTVNHRTVLGTTDCIGAVELRLRPLTQIRMPTWYRLCKKGKYGEDGQQKYRGEICLKFEFSNKLCTETMQNLSVSSFSINSFRGGSKLDTLKRKMHIGKKKGKSGFADSSSLVSLPQYATRRSSLCEVCPTVPKSEQASMVGLITPPAASRPYATLPYSAKSTGGAPGSDSPFGYNHSRRTSASSNRNSLNSSPVPMAGDTDAFESPAVIQRPRSAASSGFGSARSTVISGSEMISISRHASREELLKNINDLRVELARRDAKIYDLQDYIGRLLARIMERDPELLEITSPRSSLYRH
ncbi:unnamed protein product [Gongylonema pulchrum]|uniref:FIP-RBD domain-containing protein n=1 Tax=Gongylonema pulchrum TaxID=637853 RepID=A0A3P7RCK4_9BILA|nr:unnamed protein product [Gongylonema pulchrum]